LIADHAVFICIFVRGRNRK